MSLVVQEIYESRKVNIGFEKQSAELTFVGISAGVDYDDDVVVRAGFLAVIPTIFFNLLFQDVDIEPKGGGFWTAVAKYDSLVSEKLPGQDSTPESPPPPAPPSSTPLGPEFSFDISAVTEHITQSKSTIDRIRIGGGVAVNNNNMIGVTLDGEVAGTDRLSSHLEWSTTRQFGYVTLGYFNKLYKLVGTVNNAVFYGYAKGEVLFVGASLQTKQDTAPTMTYKFACQPTLFNITICPGLVVTRKEGWQYLWVSYKNVEDAKQLTQKPNAAYVEQIYDYGDFSTIGIGV